MIHVACTVLGCIWVCLKDSKFGLPVNRMVKVLNDFDLVVKSQSYHITVNDWKTFLRSTKIFYNENSLCRICVFCTSGEAIYRSTSSILIDFSASCTVHGSSLILIPRWNESNSNETHTRFTLKVASSLLVTWFYQKLFPPWVQDAKPTVIGSRGHPPFNHWAPVV